MECFHGDYEKCVTFRNLYKSLVHDKREYSSVKKFYYLKANVSGEGSRLINQYAITNENYVAAWNALVKRYTTIKEYLSTQLYVGTLISYPKILYESSSKIRNFLDVISESLNCFKGLEIDTATWAPILIYVLVQKMDTEACRLWENSLKNPRPIPEVDELLLFLEGRFQALENIDSFKQSPRFLSSEVQIKQQYEIHKQQQST